jgi:hypothetical protein
MQLTMKKRSSLKKLSSYNSNGPEAPMLEDEEEDYSSSLSKESRLCTSCKSQKKEIMMRPCCHVDSCLECIARDLVVLVHCPVCQHVGSVQQKIDSVCVFEHVIGSNSLKVLEEYVKPIKKN